MFYFLYLTEYMDIVFLEFRILLENTCFISYI